MHTIVTVLLMISLANSQNSDSSTGLQDQHHVLADPAITENYDESYKATAGELNLGRDFFEGDILLTRAQSDYILKSQKNDGLQTRALMKDVKSLWPKGEVPYVINEGLSDQSKDYVRSAIKEWMDKTCVKLRQKEDSDEDYVEFIYDGGCSSYVGKIGNRQTISVGSEDGSVTCKHGNIVHELAHSLGFFHEHSRPDRDDHIKVKMDNVMPGYERNFRKESKDTIDSLGVPYDYDSVMHYGAFFFGKKRGAKTIETKKKASIGQRVGLSDMDLKQAKLLYKCGGKEEEGDKRSQTINRSTHLKKAFHHFKKKSPKTVMEKKSKKAIAKDQINNVQTTSQEGPAQPATSTNSVEFTAVPVNVPQTPQETNPTNQETAAVSPTNQNEVSSSTTTTNSANQASAVTSTNQNGAITNQEGVKMTTDKAGATSFILTDDDLGEENLGKSYFEGDMILSEDQKHFLESLKFDDGQADKRALIKNTTYLWPERTVYYTFDDSVDEIGRENAEAAVQHWQEKTCLKFQHRTNEKDYINFVFEGGCASRVGRGGGMQKLTIGSTELRCKKGNIIHEMGHAVGFFHEHSRPDRDEFVKVHSKNIMPGYERNFLKFSTKFIDSLNVPYDYGSIMHYGKTFFSKLAQLLPTMTILKESDASGNEIEIGQRVALSDMDVLQANLLYKCDGRKRLSDDERDELEAEYSDPTTREGPCGDAYDAKSCETVRAKGYCQRFPRTLRRACGNTCQLCGTVPPVNVHVGKKSSLLTKLKLDHHDHK